MSETAEKQAEPTTDVAERRWRLTGAWASGALAVVAIGFQAIVGLIPPVAVLAVVSVVAVVVLLTVRSRWVGLVPVVAYLVIVGGSLRFIIDDWNHPEDFPSFVFSTTAAAAAVVGIIAGVAIIARRSGAFAMPLVSVFGALWVLAVGFSALAAMGVEDVVAQEGDVVAETRNIDFAPDQIVLDADDSGIWVQNSDAVRHTFTIAGTGLSVELPANGTGRLDVELAPGTYQVICAIEGHESMEATIVVKG